MGVKWTKEQQQVINLRDRNILVSAAAGSGKTAVLVERILTMITQGDNPMDIDNLLIVTFTKAAAGEMRERIRSGIEKRLEHEPDNAHLQRQSTLIHNAQINTIDGFCSYVIRNYFHMIDLDPGYRTAQEGEIRLMKHDVMKKVIEAAFEKGDADFLELTESYASGKTDENIEKLILQLYEYSVSYPWPKEWLEECREYYKVKTLEELEAAPWMKSLMEESRRILKDAMETLEELLKISTGEDGPYMYKEALECDVQIVKKLLAASAYNEIFELMGNIKYARLSAKKDSKISHIARDQVKAGRQEVKDTLKELKESYFFMSAQEVLESIVHCASPVGALIDLTLSFTDAFDAAKREKNLVDFSDMEHFALNILAQKKGDTITATQAAKDLSNRFQEIFIDEYQDSNLVQETILTHVSRLIQGEYNIFMVGDVKQSIYRFRLARPELFMEKYHTYDTTDSLTQRIDLHKNFRSREEVLESVNYIFRQIMGEDLGKVEYDEGAALYTGASFPEGNNPSFAATEVLLVEKDVEVLEGEPGSETARELEALAVAGRIRDMVGHEVVLDKETGAYRKVRYGDIVILLRTMSGWAETFGQVLTAQGIPSYSASKTGYFSASEVVTVLNYLHILDNPRQDIPLSAVLHSPIGGCNSQELGEIRVLDKSQDLYGSVLKYAEEGTNPHLCHKVRTFLDCYERLRSQVPYTPIHQLILEIAEATGYELYASAMPGGEQREANLRMLVEKAMEFEQTSYRGLFNFIRYIEHLQKYDVDFGEVNISESGDNVVEIMSIHKSKGLEFPIVFVSAMGKNFNQQDINASLVIHQDLGLGADCVYPEERIKYPTVMKQVIRHQAKTENLGEELRVLYVAMTRAKEKLILTGTVARLENLVVKCHRLTRRYEEKLPYGLLEKGRCYFDWLLGALARHKSFRDLYRSYDLSWDGLNPLYRAEVPFVIKVVSPMDFIQEEIHQQTIEELNREKFLQWDTEKVYHQQLHHQLKERFSFSYPYEDRRDIPVKITVSELKRQGYTQEEEESQEMYFEPDIIPLVPAFMEKKEEAYIGAARGTAYHRFLECLDWTQGADSLSVQLEQMKESGKMNDKMADAVSLEDMEKILESSLGRRMTTAARAGMLHREQPFVISQPASTVKEHWGDEESVLIQGIIDAYFQEEEELVILDYKTDRVKTPRELTERYHLQLDYYAQALERLTGKMVKEKIIYSFTLGQEIIL